MRSLRGCKASSLPTWLGNRAASSKGSPAQIVEDLRQARTEIGSTSSLRPVIDRPISGLKARDCRPIRGAATTSAEGGSGGAPSRPKDPAFLLGAGWEGGGKDVAVAVWWDFENCNVPSGIEVYKVGVNIVAGLRVCGYKGPVSISAYGDVLQLSRSAQEALASTGIRLHHIPSGGKDSSDRALLVDLILWTLDHPPPAHLFLISGDRDFSNALHRLRMMNYNILLACRTGATVSPALLGAAARVWQWDSLVRGEGLLSMKPSSDSKPPDGSSGGGSSEQAPLKPTPSSQEQPIPPDGAAYPDGGSTCRPIAPVQGLKATEDMRESPKEVKVSRPTCDASKQEVPKTVLQQFRNLLVSHPTGMMLADLQRYISNDKVSFEKDFYGHGKIVPFLFSIPHVVRVERVLLKDNKSWSYLLTSTPKPVQTVQQGTKTTADSPTSSKVTLKQGVQKTSKCALESAETPPVTDSTRVLEVGSSSPEQPKGTSTVTLKQGVQKTSKCALKSAETPPVTDSRKVLEVGSSSPEQPKGTSTEDCRIAAPQVIEEAQPKDSESSTKNVIHLNGESLPACLPAETPVEVEKFPQRDVLVHEKAPSPGLNSWLSSLMSKLSGRKKAKAVKHK